MRGEEVAAALRVKRHPRHREAALDAVQPVVRSLVLLGQAGSAGKFPVLPSREEFEAGLARMDAA